MHLSPCHAPLCLQTSVFVSLCLCLSVSFSGAAVRLFQCLLFTSVYLRPELVHLNPCVCSCVCIFECQCLFASQWPYVPVLIPVLVFVPTVCVSLAGWLALCLFPCRCIFLYLLSLCVCSRACLCVPMFVPDPMSTYVGKNIKKEHEYVCSFANFMSCRIAPI